MCKLHITVQEHKKRIAEKLNALKKLAEEEEEQANTNVNMSSAEEFLSPAHARLAHSGEITSDEYEEQCNPQDHDNTTAVYQMFGGGNLTTCTNSLNIMLYAETADFS